jgi:phosphoribosylanthranilate isomerase
MVKIKMCGLSRPEDVAAANELKPEYVGFVFWEKSSRKVDRSLALGLKAALLPEIKAVGVFVDEDPLVVAGLLNDGIIDIAQLHGSEDEQYMARLRLKAPDKPIIKAFVIKSEQDIQRAKESTAEYLLLDSGKGTGRAFNWELIRNTDFEKPFFLAGGLSPENVAEAIKSINPYGVDVSSGIETDGRKDPDKMREFKRRCYD